jgi:dihydrofolate synthase / folylpolyglutamate synthase
LEKAGIYRSKKLAICGDSDPPNSVIAFTQEIGADLRLINRDFKVVKNLTDWQYVSGDKALSLPLLALKGDFQLNNAACTVCAVQHLQPMLPVSIDSIRKALEFVTLIGRFYTLKEKPEIIVDVAHNPQAAKSLAQNLEQKICNGRTLGVFAMLADKDIAKVVQALASHISIWYLADTHNARGANSTRLAVTLANSN